MKHSLAPAGGVFHSNSLISMWTMGELAGGVGTIENYEIRHGFIQAMGLTITGLGETTEFSGFKIYPTPASDFFIIHWDENALPEDVEYKIYNSSGRLVASENHYMSGFQMRIDMSHHVPGIYMLLIKGDPTYGITRLKIIKAASHE